MIRIVSYIVLCAAFDGIKQSLSAIKLNFFYWIEEMSIVQFIIIVLVVRTVISVKESKNNRPMKRKKMNGPINGIGKNMIETEIIVVVVFLRRLWIHRMCPMASYIDLIWKYGAFLMVASGHSHRSFLGIKCKYLIQVSHRKSWTKKSSDNNKN